MYSYRDDDKRTSELGSIGGAIAVTHPLWAVSSPLRVKVSAIVYQLSCIAEFYKLKEEVVSKIRLHFAYQRDSDVFLKSRPPSLFSFNHHYLLQLLLHTPYLWYPLPFHYIPRWWILSFIKPHLCLGKPSPC